MNTIAPFDRRDYVTARGHVVEVGDTVFVMTPQSVVRGECIVEHLYARHVGDVGNVRVRDFDRRTLVTNAFCVEPDVTVTKFRPYPHEVSK